MGEKRYDHTVISQHQPASLMIVLPSGKRFDHIMKEEQLTFGRSAKCNIVLDDESVSREHAVLRSEYGQYIIEDLQSANGITLNGKRVQKAMLKNNDLVHLGKTELQISVTGAFAANLNDTASREIVYEEEALSLSSFREKIRSNSKMLIIALLILTFLLGTGLFFFFGTKKPESTSADRVPPDLVTINPAVVPTQPISPPVSPASETGQKPTAPSVAQDKRLNMMRHMESGQIHFDSGRLNEARIEWESALALDPQNEMAKLKLKKAGEEINDRANKAYNRAMQNFNYLNYEAAIQDWMLVMNLIPDPQHQLYRNAARYIEIANNKLKR